MKVLFRSPNWIGDAVLALPSAAALASRGDVRLTIIAPPYVHPIYEGLAGATLSPIDPRVRNALQARALGRALAGDDEVGIACPVSFSSALVLRLAGVPRRVGRAAIGRTFLLTDALPRWPAPPHPIRTHGAATGPPYDSRFHRWRDYAELVEHVLEEEVVERYPLHVPAASARRADDLLAEVAGAGPLVGLNPGANGPARRWPAERFGALGRALRDELDARIVVIGGHTETALAESVAEAVPGARSLADRTTLKVLMAVLERLELFVTNDTGPMHLAAALGTPLLDLCGAADERVTGPRGARARVLREFLFCSPCVRNACPFDLECMEALTVRGVLAQSLASLEPERSTRWMRRDG